MAGYPDALDFRGQTVVLTPLRIDCDVPELYRISHQNEDAKSIFRYLQRGPYAAEGEMRSFFEAWSQTPGTMVFVVRNGSSQDVMGTLSLMNIREDHGVLEIGHVWYCPSAQRTKTNTESVYMLLAYCFDELGYRRIEWKCDTRNRPSGTAALRLGFSFEGVFRKHMIIRGENRDSAWFSMLDDDWPLRKAALQTWLYTPDARPLSEVHDTTLSY
jgi:RimJ/RimL family protein N-acetyltransferase